MKCEEAAEFASRLCDGQVIPREMAEHIGTCDACRTRLNAYAAIGAELRRVASLEPPISLKVRRWEKAERVRRRWWQGGRTTIRIPRFAFVSMLVLILILSGGLVLVRARAAQGGSILLLHFTLPNGKTEDCFLTTTEKAKTNRCVFATDVPRGGMVGLMVWFISRDGDRSQLGVKANYKESSREFNFIDDLSGVLEQTISVDPPQQGHIQVPGLGEFDVTARYLNHHPVTAWGRPDEAIEPRKDEFRVVAPVLLRGNEVICNLSANGYSIDDGDPDATLMIYYPGEGRYLISRVPFEGAVEGTVRNGQIRFTLDGQNYLLLSAAPILSSEHAWVSHDPQYKLSEHLEGASDDRPWFRVRALKVVLQPELGNID